MSKRDELIAKYATDLKEKCGVNEDMDLLTQMVKSKSQAQLLANSRPATSTSILNTKTSTNLHISRQNNINTKRQHTRKGVKRTTSV